MKHADASRQNLLLDSLGHVKKQVPAVEAMLNTVGKLWQAGVDIDWDAFYGDEVRHTVPLPTYPFERQRYWVEPPPLKKHEAGIQYSVVGIQPEEAMLPNTEYQIPNTEIMNRRNRIRETLNETLAELSGDRDWFGRV